MRNPTKIGMQSRETKTRRSIGYLCSMGVAAVLVCGIATSAHAVPITLEFTIDEFPAGPSGLNNVSTDPVSGVIVYEAAALGAPIEALTSISLNAGNHSFTLAETSFLSPFGIGNTDAIFASINGAGVTHHTSDFFLQYDRCERRGVDFFYASADAFGIWNIPAAFSFSSFSLSGPGPVACGEPPPDGDPPVSVPEPGVLSLLVLGLVGALVTRLQRVR